MLRAIVTSRYLKFLGKGGKEELEFRALSAFSPTRPYRTTSLI